MATAREFTFSEEELEAMESGGGGGAYAAIEVPGTYEIILRKTDDYDKRAKGKTHGWIFFYGVEAEAGSGEAEFRVYLSFSQSARWKLKEVLAAHGITIEPGVGLNINPDSLLGDVVVGDIDFPRDNNGVPTSTYREINSIYSLASLPPAGEEEAVEVTATEEVDSVQPL